MDIGSRHKHTNHVTIKEQSEEKQFKKQINFTQIYNRVNASHNHKGNENNNYVSTAEHDKSPKNNQANVKLKKKKKNREKSAVQF